MVFLWARSTGSKSHLLDQCSIPGDSSGNRWANDVYQHKDQPTVPAPDSSSPDSSRFPCLPPALAPGARQPGREWEELDATWQQVAEWEEQGREGSTQPHCLGSSCCPVLHTHAALQLWDSQGSFWAESNAKQLYFPSVLCPHTVNVRSHGGKQGYMPALQCHRQIWFKKRQKIPLNCVVFPSFPPVISVGFMERYRHILVFFPLLFSISCTSACFSDAQLSTKQMALSGTIPLKPKVSDMDGDSLEPDISIWDWDYS